MTEFRFKPPAREQLTTYLAKHIAADNVDPCTRGLEREVDRYHAMRTMVADMQAGGKIRPHTRGPHFQIAVNNFTTGIYVVLLRHGFRITGRPDRVTAILELIRTAVDREANLGMRNRKIVARRMALAVMAAESEADAIFAAMDKTQSRLSKT